MVVGAGARRTGLRVGMCCLVAASCSSGDGDAATDTTTAAAVAVSSSAPPRPTTTTSLVYDPATVEGQVEAAYLRSWEVYAAAVYDLVLDEDALASVYAEPYLSVVRAEISDRIATGRAALVRVEHSHELVHLEATRAVMLDRYRNHQVVVDPVSKEALEPDPDQLLVDVFDLELSAGAWRVVKLERVG